MRVDAGATASQPADRELGQPGHHRRRRRRRWCGSSSAARARLLWRVRERLVVSYLFIGVVPALLIGAFFLFGIALLVVSVSAYLFMTGVNGVVDRRQGIAQAAADELERATGGMPVQAVLDRYVAREQAHFRGLSLALVPRQAAAGRRPTIGPAPGGHETSLVRAGMWAHMAPPRRDSGVARARANSGRSSSATAAATSRSSSWPGRSRAAGRRTGASSSTCRSTKRCGAAIEETTGIQMVELTSDTARPASLVSPVERGGGAEGDALHLDPQRRQVGHRAARLHPRPGLGHARRRPAPRRGSGSRRGDIFRRLSEAQGRIRPEHRPRSRALILGIIALLFLVIEGAALAMGWALAPIDHRQRPRAVPRHRAAAPRRPRRTASPSAAAISSASWPSRSTR